ncbi:alpha/beta hydrolase [Amycolatopsis sp. NBC_00348]|uniref:alpha/beta fold hydrolase n=1 Tax=unclassified Amycolatopsis TaxID=2618356 RepID=UPI002E0E65AD|nr:MULTISPECIES: alpha/beta hydrolase [unclassified Amycolatopsis]WSJ81118.1 alpha/beta hydrolase [Amycolatopsis sp. NBC_01307]
MSVPSRSSSPGRRAMVENRRDPAVIERQFRILGGATDTPERAAIREETIAAILRTVDVPVLILAGMRDGVISPESTLRAARSVPWAKAVLFEDEGHFVTRERPERLATEVAAFLEELNS